MNRENPPELKKAKSKDYFFYRQHWHLLALGLLVPAAFYAAGPYLGQGSVLGIPDRTWFILSISFAILHQVVVWLVFRLQLGWGSLTKVFGRYDLMVWAVIFFPLLISRPLFLVALGRANEGTLVFDGRAALFLGLIILIPALYTLYSVFRYFGLYRALGGDHFREIHRKMPLVNKGAFRYSGNAMYVYAFLLLWSIALFHQSQGALIAAVFQHLYIWVHYYTVEKPDMDLIFK